MIVALMRRRVPCRQLLGNAVRAAALIGVALGLGGCGISNWLHGGKSNLEPPAPITEFAAAYNVEKVWSADIGGGAGKKYIRLSPYLDDDTLYVAEAKGRVRAYKADSGKRIWEVHLKDTEIEGGTGFADGMVLLGTRKGQVVALKASNGARLWTTDLSSEVLAPPVSGSGVVVVQTVDGKVFGLAVDSGKQLWMQEHTVPALSLRGTSTPLIASDVVLTGLANGRLAAYRLTDGKQLWDVPVSEPHGRSDIERLTDVDAPPVIVGNTLYAAAYHGKIVAFSLNSGRILWERNISVYSGLAVGVNNLYVADENGKVFALSLTTGATIWEQNILHGRWLSAPAVLGNTVAFGDFEGYVHWLSTDDGRLVARYRMSSDAILAAPVAGSTTLYVADQGGQIAAFRLHSKK